MAVEIRKGRTIRGVVTFIIAVAFILIGMTKVVQLPFEVTGLGYYGLPVWFVFLLGIYEVLGGLGVIFRTTAFFAAVGLSLEMLGAILTFLLGGTPSLVILPLVTLVLTSFLAVRRWREVSGELRHAHA